LTDAPLTPPRYGKVMATEDRPTPPLSPRVVLISIAVFWAFYFAIWSLRAIFVYHAEHSMLEARAIVSLATAGVTVILYLLMRHLPVARLGRSVALALLLSIPAAIAYATINWYVFDHWEEHETMKWSWSTAPQPPVPATPAHLAMPAPPAPPPMSVGAAKPHWDDEMTPLMSIADQAANGYFFFLAWVALYLALCIGAEMGTLERRAAQLRAAAQSAELRALRYQVNPHFLFNTLNSLSSLVMTGQRDEAERMIINLSTFFRTSLTGDPTEDVPLSEEILLQRLYLDIEAVRFPERLVVDIDIPDMLRNACVPGLILQPLVENAVKYGVSRARRPVTIRIRASTEAGNLLLSVEDDGDPTNGEGGGTGVGLRNVRDRLAARFGEAAHCHWSPRAAGGFAVRMTLPLVRDVC
jgi:two-component system, LytTR family, sensor kinase